MANQKALPVALTIAGSDSGGGAGIQADLKTFAALGVHGTCAVTCVTAQNPRRVTGVAACPPQIVRRQIEAVFEELPPLAVKTGMLYSEDIVRVVANALRRLRPRWLVVDPVMISTSGARLLQPSAVEALRKQVFPLADLLTPNLDETAALIGRPVRSVEDMRQAARQLRELFGCAALVKGGHLQGVKDAVDIFYDGQAELLLSSPFIKGIGTHGTGCTYSAAITAHLALGLTLPDAVTAAKQHVTIAIASSRTAAGHHVLENFWR